MKLRPRSYRNGKKGWQIDYGMVDGKRKQVALDPEFTKKQAKDAFDDAVAARRLHGEAGAALSPGDVVELLAAKQRLNGVALMTAVEYYLTHAHTQPVVIEKPMLDVIDLYEEEEPVAKLKKRWRANVLSTLRSLAIWAAPSHAHEIVTDQLKRWLKGNGWKPKTRNNYLGEVRKFYEWAISAKFAAINPAEGIDWAEVETDDEIATLEFVEIKALLICSWELQGGTLVAFVVIGLFCMMRPEEIQQLTWSKINLAERTIIVMAKTVKTRRRRVVDIPEQALEWLKIVQPTGDQDVPVCPKNFPERWGELRRCAGWTPCDQPGDNPWIRDEMRHTGASMHYAMHQNESLLQAQMGHDDDEVLFTNYRALKTREEAAMFYALKPPTKPRGEEHRWKAEVRAALKLLPADAARRRAEAAGLEQKSVDRSQKPEIESEL